MSLPEVTANTPAIDAWANHSGEVSRALNVARCALSDEASLVLAAIGDDPNETELVQWACSLQRAANRIGAALAAFDQAEPGSPVDAVEVALRGEAM